MHLNKIFFSEIPLRCRQLFNITLPLLADHVIAPAGGESCCQLPTGTGRQQCLLSPGRPALAHPQAPLLTLQKNGFLQRATGWQQEGQQQTCAVTDCCSVPKEEWSRRSQPQGTFCSEMKSFVGLKGVELDVAFCITPSLQPCPAGKLGWLPCPWRSLPSSSSQQEAKDKSHTAAHSPASLASVLVLELGMFGIIREKYHIY